MSAANVDPWGEYFKQTVAMARESGQKLGAQQAMSYIFRRTGFIEGAVAEEFNNEALFEAGKDMLWNDELLPTTGMSLLQSLPRTRGWGNRLSDIGKYLERYGREDRSRIVLEYTADLFAEVADNMTVSPFEERNEFITEDYLRIAGLQDEVGDKEGARRTTLALAPHLLRLALEVDPEDRGDTHMMDFSLIPAIQHIGSFAYPEARQLLSVIGLERNRKFVLDIMYEKMASDFLKAGHVEGCLNTLVAKGLKPLNVWTTALSLWRADQADQRETVRQFIDGIDETFPHYYAEANNLDADLGSVVDVLILADRDDRLEDVFRSQLMDGESTYSLERFAFHCGYVGHGNRLAAMKAKLLSLTTEQSTKLDTYYDYGIEEAAKIT